MTDRPILFSAPMIQALFAGRKTQTRRVLKNPEYYGCPTGDCPHERQAECNAAMQENALPDVRFALGDRLWVKEAWADAGTHVRYYATDDVNDLRKKRSPLFMPRWASRLTLLVTNVRVHRLQDISEAAAMAEGVEWETADPPFYYVPGIHPHSLTAVETREGAAASYAKLWDIINGAGAWAANPWVVAVSFTVEQRNIDA